MKADRSPQSPWERKLPITPRLSASAGFTFRHIRAAGEGAYSERYYRPGNVTICDLSTNPFRSSTLGRFWPNLYAGESTPLLCTGTASPIPSLELQRAGAPNSRPFSFQQFRPALPTGGSVFGAYSEGTCFYFQLILLGGARLRGNSASGYISTGRARGTRAAVSASRS